MIRFILLLSVLLLATPAAALDLTKLRWVFDDGCTDSFNVPATTVNVDVSNTDNYDILNEAIDPDLNLNDAVQTSGTADGWCDSAPWRIATSSITIAGASETMWLGPIQVDPNGFYVWAQYPTAQTNYGYVVMVGHLPWLAGTFDALGAVTAQTVMTTTVNYLGPYTETSSSIGSNDEFLFPRGIQMYFRLDLTGTGDWDWDLFFTPVMGGGYSDPK